MLRKQLARTPKPWRQGDIVIWDNRWPMHKANYSDGERRLEASGDRGRNSARLVCRCAGSGRARPTQSSKAGVVAQT
jgi:hypothetical protein